MTTEMEEHMLDAEESPSHIFNEESLRKEIIKIWGEHGAHCEVYDMLLTMAKGNVRPPDAAVLEAAFREGYELGNDAGRNIDVFCHIASHNPVSDADFAWEHSDTRAALPEALSK